LAIHHRSLLIPKKKGEKVKRRKGAGKNGGALAREEKGKEETVRGKKKSDTLLELPDIPNGGGGKGKIQGKREKKVIRKTRGGKNRRVGG